MPVNLLKRLFGGTTAAGAGDATARSGAADGVVADDDAPGPASEIERVRAGDAEVAGRDQQARLGSTHSTRPLTAADGAGGNVLGTMVAARTQAGAAVASPSRPRRDDFADSAAFDQAFLSYQDARLAELARQHPQSCCRGVVYYGTDLPPAQVLREGIPPKPGDNYDLAQHQREFVDPSHPELSSALRGASLDARIPAKYAGEGGYVYQLEPRGGAFSLMDALGEKDLLPEEAELSFGARQPACQIKGYFKVGAYSWGAECYRLGHFVENPDFDPQL